MSNMVKQDSEALRRIAGKIEAQASAFKSTKESLFNKLQNDIGADESHGAWYGPLAGEFIANFNATETDFNNAYNNMINIASNLRKQADSWDRFENM